MRQYINMAVLPPEERRPLLGAVPLRRRRKLLVIMSCLFISILLGLALRFTLVTGKNGSLKPNVLVIMADDQDMLLESLSVQPEIRKRIGNEGIFYDKHYCTVAWCCPSRVNFLTGRTAHNTNVTSIAPPQGGWPQFWKNGLNEKWLPIWLQEHSIDTYYVGKLMNQFGNDDVKRRKPKGWTHSQFLVDPWVYRYHHTRWSNDNSDKISTPETDHATLVTQKRALAMIDQAAASDKQFFMMVAPVAPHVQAGDPKLSPIPPPPPGYEGTFSDRSSNLSANWNPKQASGASWVLQIPPRSADDIKMMEDVHHGRLQNLAGIDDMVAALLDRLENHNLLDNTYVIYTSDNGYHIGNHRLLPGKKCGYEEDINIPLLIRGPDVPRGKTVSNLQSHTDMAPTILDMLGLPLQDDFDGQPIPYTNKAILHDDLSKRSELVTVEFWEPADTKEPNRPTRRGAHTFAGRTYADVLPHAKNLRHITFDAEGDPQVEFQTFNNTYKSLRVQTKDQSLYYSVWCDGSHELYDMKTDPVQMNNLLSNDVDIADTGSSAWTFTNRSPAQFINRLDTLLLVMKNCKGEVCRNPWSAIFPNSLTVNNLGSALDSRFDAFFAKQPKVSFDTCVSSYIPQLEGPNDVIPYRGQ